MRCTRILGLLVLALCLLSCGRPEDSALRSDSCTEVVSAVADGLGKVELGQSDATLFLKSGSSWRTYFRAVGPSTPGENGSPTLFSSRIDGEPSGPSRFGSRTQFRKAFGLPEISLACEDGTLEYSSLGSDDFVFRYPLNTRVQTFRIRFDEPKLSS